LPYPPSFLYPKELYRFLSGNASWRAIYKDLFKLKRKLPKFQKWCYTITMELSDSLLNLKRMERINMGLKFERTDDLDKLFDAFAVDPKKVEMPKEELEKQQEKEAKKEK
jgi:hypothetical protein